MHYEIKVRMPHNGNERAKVCCLRDNTTVPAVRNYRGDDEARCMMPCGNSQGGKGGCGGHSRCQPSANGNTSGHHNTGSTSATVTGGRITAMAGYYKH